MGSEHAINKYLILAAKGHRSSFHLHCSDDQHIKSLGLNEWKAHWPRLFKNLKQKRKKSFHKNAVLLAIKVIIVLFTVTAQSKQIIVLLLSQSQRLRNQLLQVQRLLCFHWRICYHKSNLHNFLVDGNAASVVSCRIDAIQRTEGTIWIRVTVEQQATQLYDVLSFLQARM